MRTFMRITMIAMILFSKAAMAQDIDDMKKCVGFVFGQVHVKGSNGQATLVEGPLGTAFFVFFPDKTRRRELRF